MNTIVRSVAGLAALLLMAAACTGGDGGGAGAAATGFQHIHGLAVAADATPYVATHGGLVRRSGDGWEYASTDRNDHMGFIMDPTGGTMWRSGHSASRPSLGVETSTDGGATWTRLSDVLDPPVDFHAMAVSYADPSVLYGWDSGGRGLFRSEDAGTTWTKLEPTGLPDPRVFALAAPAEQDVVYAGTPAGLFTSHDRGETWTAVSGYDGGAVTAIGCDPGDPAHLLVAGDAGIVRTTDGGGTWAMTQPPTSDFVGALAISPAEEEVAYASATTTVFESRNGGTTWNEL